MLLTWHDEPANVRGSNFEEVLLHKALLLTKVNSVILLTSTKLFNAEVKNVKTQRTGIIKE